MESKSVFISFEFLSDFEQANKIPVKRLKIHFSKQHDFIQSYKIVRVSV